MLIVLVEDEADDALVSALQAARTPPAPVASAPTPMPLSTDRRGRPSSSGCPPAPLPGPISSPFAVFRGDSVTLLPLSPACHGLRWRGQPRQHRHSAS